MENPSQDQNKEQKQSNKILPENTHEIESLNDSEELDIEDLEKIDGGSCGQNNGCCTHAGSGGLEAFE